MAEIGPLAAIRAGQAVDPLTRVAQGVSTGLAVFSAFQKFQLQQQQRRLQEAQLRQSQNVLALQNGQVYVDLMRDLSTLDPDSVVWKAKAATLPRTAEALGLPAPTPEAINALKDESLRVQNKEIVNAWVNATPQEKLALGPRMAQVWDPQDLTKAHGIALDELKAGSNNRIKLGNDLRKEAQQINKRFEESLGAVDSLRFLTAGKTAGVKQFATVKAFVRLFDKGIVTGSEYDVVSGAAGAWDRAKLLLQRLVTGNILTDPQVQQIKEIAQNFKPIIERRRRMALLSTFQTSDANDIDGRFVFGSQVETAKIKALANQIDAGQAMPLEKNKDIFSMSDIFSGQDLLDDAVINKDAPVSPTEKAAERTRRIPAPKRRRFATMLASQGGIQMNNSLIDAVQNGATPQQILEKNKKLGIITIVPDDLLRYFSEERLREDGLF